MSRFVVGQKVLCAKDIYGFPDDDGPGGHYARKNDILIVRHLADGKHHDCYVSHEHRTDNSFGVRDSEIKPYTVDLSTQAVPAAAIKTEGK